MANYTFEPWPSTYLPKGEVAPTKLRSKFEGRTVGAMRAGIPPRTFEPPQVHIFAPRDGQPFEELLTDFDQPFGVMYYDFETGARHVQVYQPGEDIVVPAFKVHWLVNGNDTELAFTCEYAPHPWDGDKDEPEFRNLETLLAFVDERGLRQELLKANRDNSVHNLFKRINV